MEEMLTSMRNDGGPQGPDALGVFGLDEALKAATAVVEPIGDGEVELGEQAAATLGGTGVVGGGRGVRLLVGGR